MGVSFGSIADVHNGPATGNHLFAAGRAFTQPDEFIWGVNDQRWYSTAPTRYGNFATWAQSAGLDFGIQLADMVLAQDTDTDGELTEIVAAMSAYTGPYYNMLGNHEIRIWEETDADWTNYLAAINNSAMDDVHDAGLDAGVAANAVATGYSFDIGGIHFIVIPFALGFETVAATVAWMEANLDATSLPIVAFSHHWLREKVGDESGPIGGADATTVREALEAYNVQAVISGHAHPVGQDDYRYSARVVVNEIPYYALRGSTIASSDSVETPPQTDHSYYKFEIEPNAIKGNNRMLANIKVTGYEWASRFSKDYNTYGMFG